MKKIAFRRMIISLIVFSISIILFLIVREILSKLNSEILMWVLTLGVSLLSGASFVCSIVFAVIFIVKKATEKEGKKEVLTQNTVTKSSVAEKEVINNANHQPLDIVEDTKNNNVVTTHTSNENTEIDKIQNKDLKIEETVLPQTIKNMENSEVKNCKTKETVTDETNLDSNIHTEDKNTKVEEISNEEKSQQPKIEVEKTNAEVNPHPVDKNVDFQEKQIKNAERKKAIVDFFKKIISVIKKPFQKFAAENPYFRQTMSRINNRDALYAHVNMRIKDGDLKQGCYLSLIDGKGVIYGTTQEDYFFEKGDIVEFKDTGNKTDLRFGNDWVSAMTFTITFKDGIKVEADMIVLKLKKFIEIFDVDYIFSK